MTQYIGQITVILASDTPPQASATPSVLSKQLDDTAPEVVFADHNGDIEDYEQAERDCEAQQQTKAACLSLEPSAPACLAASKVLTALERAEYLMRRVHEGDHRALQKLEDAADQAHAALAEANAASDPANQPYSVLLLYPDYASDELGKETYYAFVTAADSLDAVAVAQRKAAAAQDIAIHDPADFAPLLVIKGHHYGQPLSNQ